MNELPFRPNVCLLIANHEKKLFLGERKGSPGAWQLPQGGAEPELSLEENALKEAHEELGCDKELFRIVTKLNAVHQYDYDKIPKHSKGKFRGQAQTFWVLAFLGQDRDIELDRFHAEFTDWCWATPQEIRDRAETKRQQGYRAPLLEFEALTLSEELYLR